MAKRLLSLLIVLLVLAASPAYPGGMIIGSGGGGGEAPTDYTDDANCMGAWFMNGSSTTETDQSGHSETLTETYAIDGIVRSSTVPTGFSGYSRDFELTESEYLSGGADGTDLDINGAEQSVTVFVRFRSEDTTYSYSAHIAGKNDTAANQRQYRLGLNTSGYAEFRLSSNGTSSTAVVGSANVADGNWHSAAGVYDAAADKLYLYVDGSSAADAVDYSGGIYNGSAFFNIGGDNALTNLLAFDGLICEVIVLNRACSSSEISEMDANGIDGTKGAND